MFSFRWDRSALAVGLVTAVVLATIAMPGNLGTALAQTGGTPPPPPPAVVTITVVVNNETQTIVTTPGNLGTVTLPAGSQVTSISLTVTTNPEQAGATAIGAVNAVTDFVADVLGGTSTSSFTGAGTSDGQLELGYVFDISFGGSARAIGARGPALVMDYAALREFGREAFQTSGPTVLAKAAVGTLNVKAETLAQVGGDLSRVSVYFVDPAKKVIEPVKMLPSPGPGKVSFEFTKAGSYAVMVNAIVAAPAAGAATPAAGAVVPRPANTGTGLPVEMTSTVGLLAVAASVLVLGAAAGGTAIAVRRRR